MHMLGKNKLICKFSWQLLHIIYISVLISFGIGDDVQQMHKKANIIFDSSFYVLHVLEFSSNKLLSISFLIYEIVYIRLNESSGRSLFLLTKYIYILLHEIMETAKTTF
jgi:hypothetical protein